jgi:alpha-ketoglutarate-dependent 2,4-dichlorophenoxyacetate dioxygenase
VPFNVEPWADAQIPDFVGIVSGVDLREPLAAGDRDAIVKACDRYGLLVFRDQPLSKEALATFGANFGELDTSLQRKLINPVINRLKLDSVSDVSNLDENNQIAADDHWQTITTIGNRFWHSDGSYRHLPPRYSILSAQVVVREGGETQYADLRDAYDTLDNPAKQWIQDKISLRWSHNTRTWLEINDSDEIRHAFPKTRWPMVRTHPGSGRKVLWVDSKICAIEGVSTPATKTFVHEMLEHIGQRERVYSHKWRPGDIVMYDNRSVLHRGRRFNHSERREMRRVEVDDDVCSLGEVPHAPSQAA